MRQLMQRGAVVTLGVTECRERRELDHIEGRSVKRMVSTKPDGCSRRRDEKPLPERGEA